MTTAGKLPVWKTVFASWRYLAMQWRTVLPLAALLLLAGPALVLWLPVESQIVGLFPAAPYVQMFLLDILSSLPFFMLAAIALVSLHRAILTGSTPPGRRNPFRLGRREARYFLFVVAMQAAYDGFEFAIMRATDWVITALLYLLLIADDFGPTVQMMLLPAVYVLAIPIIAIIVYVPFRLSLALPAIAIDRDHVLSHAWKIGRGNGWRLVAVVLIALLPVLVIVTVWTTAFETPGMVDGEWIFLPDNSDAGPPLALTAAWTALAYAVFALIEATALSMSYKALGGLDEAA